MARQVANISEAADNNSARRIRWKSSVELRWNSPAGVPRRQTARVDSGVHSVGRQTRAPVPARRIQRYLGYGIGSGDYVGAVADRVRQPTTYAPAAAGRPRFSRNGF